MSKNAEQESIWTENQIFRYLFDPFQRALAQLLIIYCLPMIIFRPAFSFIPLHRSTLSLPLCRSQTLQSWEEIFLGSPCSVIAPILRSLRSEKRFRKLLSVGSARHELFSFEWHTTHQENRKRSFSFPSHKRTLHFSSLSRLISFALLSFSIRFIRSK